MLDSIPTSFSQATIIINPSRKPGTAHRLERLLLEYGTPLIIMTESREHFIKEIEAFHASASSYLLVAGGDGTVHDAVNTLYQLQQKQASAIPKSIGFFRGGSGNGYQDSYEIPETLRSQVETFVQSVENDHRLTVDLLKYSTPEQSGYGQLVGTGFDAHVLYKREKRKIKRRNGKVVTMPGLINYVVAILGTYLSFNPFKNQQFEVEFFNGRYSYRGTRVNTEYAFESLSRRAAPGMVEIGKRPYFARQFKICPDAVCNDGNLDAYIFNMKHKFTVMFHFLSLWNGWHDLINFRFLNKGRPAPVEHYEIEKVRISSGTPFHYHVDGELRETAEAIDGRYILDVEIVPQAMSFIVPYKLLRKFHPF